MAFKEPRSIWKDIRKGILFVVVLSAFMALFEYYGAFANIDGKMQDRFWLRHGRSASSNDMIVLEIDDGAYAQLFKSVSPMSPTILTDLVRQIASVQPTVVGIDVLTTSEADGGDTYRRFAEEKLGAKVIWISGEVGFDPHSADFFKWISGKDDELVVKPTEVLGYGLEDLKRRPEILWGPAVNPTEQDLRLRRFFRELKVSENVGSLESATPKESWARMVAQQYCKENPGKCNKHLEGAAVYLKADGRRPFSAGLLEFFTRSGEHAVFKQSGRELLKQLAKGKIALVGGTFAHSGDVHETSDGSMAGIFLNARAIAAEVDGVEGAREIQEPYGFLLDVGFGVLVVLVFAVLGWFQLEPRAARTMMIGSAIVAVATMVILYFSGYMFSVVAVVIAAIIQQAYDFWTKNPKIVEESE
jgi:CHASE2 domain-containing sensor protein